MLLNYDIVYGTFIARPNRFIAHIEADHGVVIAHVPNTGRLRELLTVGIRVLLSYHPSPHRKTQYELRMIEKNGIWISIDSQLPNPVVAEGIRDGVIKELQGYANLRREVTYQRSRFDIQLEGPGVCFVEVKGVTLEENGWGYFPDAPTERGRKHIEEMIRVVEEGYRGVLMFLVQHPHIGGFSPNAKTDPDFAEILQRASAAGVEVLCYQCSVSPDEVRVVGSLPVKL